MGGGGTIPLRALAGNKQGLEKIHRKQTNVQRDTRQKKT